MSGRAIKRSEESGGGAKMMSARPKIAASEAKATGEQDSKHSISDAQGAAAASARAQQPANSTKLVFGLNPRAHRSKRQEVSEQTLPAESKPQPLSNGVAAPSSQSRAPAKGHIRASKYGNFYKPQDLGTPTSTTTTASASRNQQATSGGSSTTTTTMTKSSEESKRVLAPQARKPTESSQPKQQQQQQKSVRARSKSPDRPSGAQMGRRKSFDEDISTTKSETPAAQLQQQPILKTRTQFNILPPPQMSIATTGKGSVVDYAKSRIYDKPVKRILANPPPPTVLDDQPGQVPASILSGFKPPKQVMVSKAREKWEGGEPFAKCKSRKRLAAQANKKLFPGTWSMTSVVATQQLHLQQALAQFNSTGWSSASSSTGFNRNSNYLQSDPSVKVLTRGSVLERIQQYEKAPGSGAVLSGSSSCDSFFDEEDDRQISLALSRSSSASSRLSLGSDGDGEPPAATDDDTTTTTTTSKQAQYKSRVSSIQQQQQQHQNDCAQAAPTTSPAISSQQNQQQQRRQSLRRRSSIGLLGRRASTQSLIPRFYHPNGKPNTYEIEIQKRNIVACFEKLPERRAQLTNENVTGKRQFHQIAQACGYSEYFKVPLQLYVKHKLETNPQLASLGQVGPTLTLQRKSSTVALNTNGTTLPRPLIKSASIDSAAKQAQPGGENNGEKKKKKEQENPNEPEISSATCDQFLACWRELIGRAYDNAAQFVHLLTFGQRNYLQPEDFVPLVQSIIDDHPGLKFLRAAPDFHMRYIQTVIARIYYNVNRSWTGKLTLQELRKSNLLAVLQVLSQEEDINQITDYFSYEHFYVIYCKFWSLDQDHDLFISKEDLARHNDAAISSRIIERIFAGIVSKQIQKTGKMGYSDFVWFIIAEEDKKHPRSIEYWFRLMDLDGDGYISMYEMEYFYYEQMKRLELMNIEALPFLDSACQILDLVNPREKNKISLADLKRTRMATIFFDTFINLEKYLEHESREFVSTRDIVQNGVVVSDWDRYASEEYENLVTEESTV